MSMPAEGGPVSSLATALEHHDAGRLCEAESLYRAVLLQEPTSSDALYLMAALAVDMGRVRAGVTLLRRAASELDSATEHATPGPPLDQGRLAQLLSRSLPALMRRGKWRAALICCERCLAAAPEKPDAYNNHGIVLQALGRHEQALASYDIALAHDPDFAEAHNNRGNALRALGRPADALSSYEAALRLRSSFAQAHNNRGNVLRELGRPSEALAAYEQALALQFDFVLAESNRGQVLLELKRPKRALASFESALRMAPASAEAQFGYASAALELGRPSEALAAFEQARRLGMNGAEICVGKAAALAEMRRHAEAAAQLTAALQLAPDYPLARGSLLHARLHSCGWDDIGARLADVERRIGQGEPAAHPQSMLTLSDSPALLRRCAERFVAERYPQQSAELRRSIALAGARHRHADKIRLAYVFDDPGAHPAAAALTNVLEQHDRERFEIIGCTLAAQRSGLLSERVRRGCDRWLEIDDGSDREAALQLAECGADIAVDLMGFSRGMRLGIFAHRAAPVQMSYLGYCGTLAAPYIDYLIADPVVVPRGEERWYTEQVVRLPHCFMSIADEAAQAGRVTRPKAENSVAERAVLLCSLGSADKIHPALFDAWMQMLAAAPEAVLWLGVDEDEAIATLRNVAGAHGVAAERLQFAPHTAAASERLERLAHADLYLDTAPCNDWFASAALAAGVPLLTCAGRSFAARVGASALTALGMAELITHDLSQYRQRGIELVQSPAALRSLKRQLLALRAQASPPPPFNARAHTRALESVYQFVSERSRRGLAPLAFDVRPVASAPDP